MMEVVLVAVVIVAVGVDPRYSSMVVVVVVSPRGGRQTQNCTLSFFFCHLCFYHCYCLFIYTRSISS